MLLLTMMTDKEILDTLQHIQDEIASTLNELSSIKKEMEKQSDEENMRVFKFIINLQRSGFSQQFNVEESIQKHFGFSKEQSEKVLFKYIEQLSEINERFGGTIPVSTSSLSDISEANSHVSDLPAKKKKGPKPYSEMTPEELAAAKAKRLEKSMQTPRLPETVPVSNQEEPSSKPAKRIVKVKKVSDGIKIWNSFLKIVKLEMEASGDTVGYDDLVKKAKEMKEADKSAYELFSSTWTPEDDSSSNNT